MLGLMLACGSEPDEKAPQTESTPEVETEIEWINYSIDAPTGAILSMLTVSPYLYPTQTCKPMSPSDQFSKDATIRRGENGQEVRF